MQTDFNEYLISTDGTWDGTSFLANGEPLFADRLRIRIKVYRNALDRITDITCDHFILLQEALDDDTGRVVQQAGYVGVFPGTFEVDVRGKSIRITNTSLTHENGRPILDPNGFQITYRDVMDDLEDPIAHWLSQNGVREGQNLVPVLDELTIDFNGPEDHWYVAVSLFKGRLIGTDTVTPFILGVSKNIGHLNLFDL